MQPQSLFDDLTAANPCWTDSRPQLTIGTLIQATVDGEIVGGRWLFPQSAPAGRLTAQWVLYDNNSRQVLRRATFGTPTWGAWNTVAVEPLPVLAGRWLVAAVYLSATIEAAYPYTHAFFTSARTNGNLFAPATGADPAGIGNGRYRNAGQCSGLQAGGEGPRWEGRQGPSSALTWPVLLLDVLLHDGQWCVAGGRGEVRAGPELVGLVVVGCQVGELLPQAA